MAISETHLRDDKPSDIQPPRGYDMWTSERSGKDKGGGGLCIMYNEELNHHRWKPEVPTRFQYLTNERQWLFLYSGTGKLAFLHVYIACANNNSEDFISWNEDLFELISSEAQQLRLQGFSVFALGDFNSRVGQIPGLRQNIEGSNRNAPMFHNFLQQANLVIVNTLPIAKGLFTYFMNDGRRSLLDYGLIDDDHVETVSSFVIDEDARFACGSDHALLEAKIIFGHTLKTPWKFEKVFQYNFHSNSNFSSFQKTLDKLISEIPIHDFVQMKLEDMLPHLSKSLRTSGKEIFGVKMKKRKKGRKLPEEVLRSIRSKQDLDKKYRRALECSNQNEAARFYQQLQNEKANFIKTIYITYHLQ